MFTFYSPYSTYAQLYSSLPIDFLPSLPTQNKRTYTTQLKVGLHYGPWSWTMEDGLFPWSEFIIQLSMVRLLKILILKALGPLLDVKRM